MNEDQTTTYQSVPLPEPNYDALFGGLLVLLIFSGVGLLLCGVGHGQEQQQERLLNSLALTRGMGAIPVWPNSRERPWSRHAHELDTQAE